MVTQRSLLELMRATGVDYRCSFRMGQGAGNLHWIYQVEEYGTFWTGTHSIATWRTYEFNLSAI